MKKILITLMVAITSSAMFIDNSDYLIRVKDLGDRRYFYKCHRPTSSCQLLTPDGLHSEDFARLATVLNDNYQRALVRQEVGAKIEKSAIALLALTVTTATYLLHRRGAIRLVTKCHHRSHGWWHKLRDHLPRVDFKVVKRFFFNDNSWLPPIILSEGLAVFAGQQIADNSANQQTVYQFLQSELANLQEIGANDEKVIVRSVSATEFMIYEIVRLRRVTDETQTVDH